MRFPTFRAPRSVSSLVGVALALVLGFMFLELAEDVREGETDAFDTAVLAWVAQHRSPPLS